MSDWFYIRLAFALAWSVLGGYALLLYRRTVRAEHALRQMSEER